MMLIHKSIKQVFRSSSGATENNRGKRSLKQVSRERGRGEEGEGGREGRTEGENLRGRERKILTD